MSCRNFVDINFVSLSLVHSFMSGMAEIETAALVSFPELRQALFTASEWLFVFHLEIHKPGYSSGSQYGSVGFLSSLIDAWSSAPLTLEEKKALLSFIKHYMIRIQAGHDINIQNIVAEEGRRQNGMFAGARISLGDQYIGLFAVLDYENRSISLDP
jgi:hypothetical protein